jgi:hypothetical protein
MKNRLIIGILFLILGAAIAWGPQTVFPICGVRTAADSIMSGMSGETENNSGHAMTEGHMKCWYTGRWEIGTGSAISVLGLLFILLKKKKLRIALSIAAFLSGLFALLIPTVLVGVCPGTHMDCHAIALPALVILSGAVMLTAAINTIFLFKLAGERRKENAE